MKSQNFPSQLLPDPLRRKLLLGLPGSIVAMSPFALVGCGGGEDFSDGPGTPPPREFRGTLPLTPLTVSLKLPSNLAYGPDQLAVVSLPYGDAVVRDNSATIGVLGVAPQLATVLTYGGYPLLYGFVSPDNPEISPLSTAVVLLSFNVGTIWLGAIDAILQESIAQTAQAQQLAAILETLLNADDSALARGDTRLTTAVRTAVSQLLPHVPQSSGS